MPVNAPKSEQRNTSLIEEKVNYDAIDALIVATKKLIKINPVNIAVKNALPSIITCLLVISSSD